jgi:hypothetical protein
MELALRLLSENLMTGWIVAFSNAKRQLGAATVKNGLKVIYLSKTHVNNDAWEEVNDTVRHELAHAKEFDIYGRMSGHGPVWKSLAARMGAKPERTMKRPPSEGNSDHRWALVFGNEVLARYYRYPKSKARNLATLQVAGRPETKGNIRLVELR